MNKMNKMNKPNRKEVTEEFYTYVNGICNMGYPFKLVASRAPKVNWEGRTERLCTDPEYAEFGSYVTVSPSGENWEFRLISGHNDSTGILNKYFAIDLVKEVFCTDSLIREIEIPEKVDLIWQIAIYLSYHSIPYSVNVDSRGNIGMSFYSRYLKTSVHSSNVNFRKEEKQHSIYTLAEFFEEFSDDLPRF